MTLALKEEDEVHNQTSEEPFKRDDDFELNEVVKDVIHGTYFLDLEKEKLVPDFLPYSHAHKFQIEMRSDKRNLLMRETEVEKAPDKRKEINALVMLESDQIDFKCSLLGS